MKQPIWFAILVGLIVVSAATFVFTIAVLSVFLIIHGRPGDTISQPVGLVVGALGVATGGFVAARMSGVRGMKSRDCRRVDCLGPRRGQRSVSLTSAIAAV